MRLHLNGELREAPDLATLADLARWLELPAFGSAIELNGEVIRRADHPATGPVRGPARSGGKG